MLGLPRGAPHLTLRRRGVEYSLIREAHCSRTGIGVDRATRRGMRDDTADHPGNHSRPVPTITSPPDGASVTAEELIVSGTGEPGYAVQLFRRDILVAGTSVRSNGTWSIPLPLAAEGRHTFAVTGIDEAGRASAQSPATSLTV